MEFKIHKLTLDTRLEDIGEPTPGLYRDDKNGLRECRFVAFTSKESVHRGCGFQWRIFFNKDKMDRFYLSFQNLGRDDVLSLKRNENKAIVLEKEYTDQEEFIKEVIDYICNIFFAEFDTTIM